MSATQMTRANASTLAKRTFVRGPGMVLLAPFRAAASVLCRCGSVPDEESFVAAIESIGLAVYRDPTGTLWINGVTLTEHGGHILRGLNVTRPTSGRTVVSTEFTDASMPPRPVPRPETQRDLFGGAS